ncbi:LPS translocon maturation chaperone LptM [Algiphilus aromaticivorans]|uniref:LPS translocon maturation chaperone LptM n=1 Tax=Algiphilus aromaticivorans TaxID=382454 RepID=UPI001E32DACC|nr:lipoprotein [Algiphilus aromaticivorans]
MRIDPIRLETRRRMARALIPLLLLLLLLAGCGQSGDLYLPEKADDASNGQAEASDNDEAERGDDD